MGVHGLIFGWAYIRVGLYSGGLIFGGLRFIEGQKICNGWPPKAGIGETVNFEPLFLVDMDGEKFLKLFLLVIVQKMF